MNSSGADESRSRVISSLSGLYERISPSDAHDRRRVSDRGGFYEV